MKAKLLGLAVVLVTVSLMGRALAQSNLNIRVSIPFQFLAEDKTFAAGEYEITQLNETVLVLRNLDDHSSAVEKAGIATSALGAEDATALVFHHVGGQYFLDQVRMQSTQEARQLLVSSQERQLTQAGLKPKVEVVSLVAHDTGFGGK